MNRKFGLANATPELVVFGSIVSALVWSVAMFMQTQSSEKYLGILFNNDVWGFVFFNVATLQCWRLIGREIESPTKFTAISDMCVGFFSATVWTLVSFLSVMTTYPPSPYVGTTVMLAVGTWWDFWAYHPHISQSKREVATGKQSMRVA